MSRETVGAVAGASVARGRLVRRAAAVLRTRWKALTAFALLFRLLEGVLFTPMSAIVGHALLGRPVVDSTAIVAFLLSPRGAMLAFLALAIALTLRLVEHAGLSAMVLGDLEGHAVQARAAARLVAAELPRLFRLAVGLVGRTIVVALPLLAATAVFAARLLRRHDINYYLARRPPEFVAAAVVLGLIAPPTLAAAAWLLVRWRFIVQVSLFDRTRPADPYAASTALARGAFLRVAVTALGMGGFVLGLGIIASFLADLFAILLHGATRGGVGALAIAFGLLITLRTAVGAVVTLAGSCADAALFTVLYRDRCVVAGRPPVLPAAVAGTDGAAVTGVVEAAGAPARRGRPGWLLPAGALIGVVIFAVVGAFDSAAALRHDSPTAVTAHRGGTVRAPENTVAAIREAIEVGAQYAEIDIQTSKDGVIVVTHDRDFSRLAGVARNVRDLTWEEIRAIPVGGRAAPEFHDERTPTLDAVLATARDRIRLNIELKYYGDDQPDLVARAIDAVRAAGMSGQVIFQSLEYAPLQEARRLAPDIPVGYLFSVNARAPQRLEVDFLSVESARVNARFLADAHGRGQQVYVWTVDQPADMQRIIDLGVDNLITNQPSEALRLVRAHEALPAIERARRTLHAWLVE